MTCEDTAMADIGRDGVWLEMKYSLLKRYYHIALCAFIYEAMMAKNHYIYQRQRRIHQFSKSLAYSTLFTNLPR